MEITRNSVDTTVGPSDWFKGTVYIDAVASPSGQSRLQASNVHFAPGSRTAWHTHPYGQTIYVLEGICYCASRGGSVDILRPGDRAFFGPGEEHWHGATPDRLASHLALQLVDDEGHPATWLEHVTDEEYAQGPPLD